MPAPYLDHLHTANHHSLDQWCITEKNTCGELCGTSKYTKTNNCDPVGSLLPAPTRNPYPISLTIRLTMLSSTISPPKLTRSTDEPQLRLRLPKRSNTLQPSPVQADPPLPRVPVHLRCVQQTVSRLLPMQQQLRQPRLLNRQGRRRRCLHQLGRSV